MWHTLCAEGEIRGEDDKSILQITRLCVYYSELEHGIQSSSMLVAFGLRHYQIPQQTTSTEWKRKAIITEKDEDRESESPSGILICSSSFVPHETAADSGLV